jgi:hypothetical protein
MTASSLHSDTATKPADRFGPVLLLVNGLLLGIIALVSSLADLAGYFLAIGPFAASHAGNPIAVGSFEAHGLAFIVAVLLVLNRNAPGPAWNWTAAGVHLLLGTANLLFWPVFTRYGLVPMGYATTIMHAVFVVLQVIAALRRTADTRAP